MAMALVAHARVGRGKVTDARNASLPRRKARRHTGLAALGGRRHFCAMNTLAEIEKSVTGLSADDLAKLERCVRKARQEQRRPKPHSVLDLKPVKLGKMLRPLGNRTEWHEEMLEGRG